MRTLRRMLQVVAFVGTITVGILAVALIVSQTPWFRDWLRRYIVRESKQYLNGQLSIGALGGNLLFGVNLADVAVDVSGERVLAVKSLGLDYSVFEIASSGLVLDGITIERPVMHVERDATGWNLARLVKRERQEADREGPRRPVSMPSIKIADASVSIQDHAAGKGYNLPARLEGLDVTASFEYAPVHYSLTLDHISFHATSPELSLRQLSGKLAVRDDNLYVDKLGINTAETSVTIDGVVEQYLRTPVVQLTATGNVSLPEIGRLLPAAAGYRLHPAIDVKANGPADQLDLVVDVRSEAGNIKGQVIADVQAPDFGVRGEVDLARLNLAPILQNAAQRTDLTGHAKIDVTMASSGTGGRPVDRLKGTFAFAGPSVTALGYQASHVTVTGTLAGPRITFDGRGAAYGSTATARGFILTPAPGRALAFDLRGNASHVDLRRLPASIGAPKLATDLSVAEYHVRGDGASATGSAVLHRSTVEGATLAEGTSGEFSTSSESISYSARGSTSDLNLERIGQALQIAALAQPRYDSRINGSFDVAGTVPRAARGGRVDSTPAIETMTLDATANFKDSVVLGGQLPEMAVDAHLDHGTLKGHATGRFEGFNPAQIAERPNLDGRASGTVNANFSISHINAPLTSDALTADGTLALTQSTIGGLRLDTANVDGRYAAQVADLTRLQVTGPDVKVDASGRLALDQDGQSALKYHVEAVNLPELAKLAGQTGVGGAAILDGTVSGNARTLTTTGTLDGSNLSYGTNNALDLDSRYTVTVPDLSFAAAHIEATSDATFVVVGGTQLNSVKATTTYDKSRLDFTTSIKENTRELDATGQLILHPDHQEVHLPQLSLRTQGVEWRTASGSQAAILYGRGRIELKDVKLVSGDQSLDVSGAIALKGEAAAGALDVHARQVDLPQLETLLLQNRGLTGKLNANATISGSTDAPLVEGHLEVNKGGFRAYQYESLIADLDYKGPRVGVDATLRQSSTESITARGSVPTSIFGSGQGGGHVEATSGDEIDLQIKSTALGLGLVQGMTKDVTDVTGTLEADVHVGGSGRDPHLIGYVDIKNGAFGVPALGGSFTGLTTRIDLQPDRMHVQQFQLLDHHGEKLTIAGDLAVHEREVGAVNVTIDSDNFEVIDNEFGDVQMQSALKITGELRRPKVVGDVRLDAARIEVGRILELFYDPYNVTELPDVVSAERTAERSASAEEATKTALAKASQSAAAPAADTTPEPAVAPAPGTLFDAVALDVHVIVPDNLVLRGKDLRPSGPTGTALGTINITVGGDMHVRKEPGGRVTPVGTVNTVRGTYDFQGRRFDLVRGGTIRFIGTPTINPLLDVTATRTIPNTGVEARVNIKGTTAAPELTLSSNPPLDDSDILALIVFNRPVNELGTGERSSLAATAGGIATGFIASPLGESIAKALDVDLFEITTSTESGDLGAGVTVGQQMGDRAFLKLRQQFGERSTSEFMIEYQLAKFLRFNGTAAPETSGSANRVNQRRVERGGIDLIFFFSY
jgi:autotransporter translocation and assembly factor TamB